MTRIRYKSANKQHRATLPRAWLDPWLADSRAARSRPADADPPSADPRYIVTTGVTRRRASRVWSPQRGSQLDEPQVAKVSDSYESSQIRTTVRGGEVLAGDGEHGDLVAEQRVGGLARELEHVHRHEPGVVAGRVEGPCPSHGQVHPGDGDEGGRDADRRRG